MLRTARRMQGVRRTLIREIFDSAPPDAINLGLGQPDLPTPASAGLAGIAGITEGRTGYTSTAGDPRLRAAVAREYAPFAAGPEQVVITVGTQEAMFAVALVLLDPGTEWLYPDPGYPAYPTVARLVGAGARPYPLRPERRFRLDPADVLSRIGSETRAVILCSPSNPTGAVNEPEDVDRLVRELEARRIAWISDEVYSGFVYEGALWSPTESSRGAGVVISGLSKNLSMTGWRVGWVVAPAELAARISAAHQYLVTCAPAVSQCAALAAFTERGRDDARRYLEIFRRRRALMASELARIPGLAVHRPDGAFYYFVDVSHYGEAPEVARRILERRKVITIPGEAFGAGGAAHLRISFAASDADIVRGVRKIGAELTGA